MQRRRLLPMARRARYPAAVGRRRDALVRGWLNRLTGSDSAASHPLVASSLWSVVLRIGGALLSFLVGVQLARYLGPAGFGIYGVILGIVTLLWAVAQLGLPTLAVREIARTRTAADWSALRGVLTWFPRAAAAAGTALGLAYVAVVLAVPGVTGDFLAGTLWAAALVPVMACTILLNAELRALDSLLKGQSIEILLRPGATALLLFALMALQGSMSPADALAMNLAGTAFALLIGLAWLRQAVPPPARLAAPVTAPRAWLAAGLPLALTDGLRQLDSVYGVLVMGALATAAETGIFRVAASTIIIVATPLSVLHVVLAPTLARLHFERRPQPLQRLLALAALAMLGAALAGTAVVALFGQWLITILFGADYAGAWLPLLILCVAQSAGAFFGVAFVLLGVAEGERDLARAFLVSVALSIAAAVPLALSWGAVGVALAAVLGQLVNNGLAWLAVRRRMGLDASPFGLLRSSVSA